MPNQNLAERRGVINMEVYVVADMMMDMGVDKMADKVADMIKKIIYSSEQNNLQDPVGGTFSIYR